MKIVIEKNDIDSIIDYLNLPKRKLETNWQGINETRINNAIKNKWIEVNEQINTNFYYGDTEKDLINKIKYHLKQMSDKLLSKYINTPQSTAKKMEEPEARAREEQRVKVIEQAAAESARWQGLRYGKSKSKVTTKRLKQLCKKHGIRLTIKRNGKRIAKSEKTLLKQLKNKMR